MWSIIRVALFFLIVISLMLLHIGVSFLLPYPFNKLNIIAACIMLYISIREQGSVVWISLLLHLFLELYAITPFGSILFPAVMSTLVTYWIHRDVLTNRSWYAAVSLTVIFLTIYRFGYICCVLISQTISNQIGSMNYKHLVAPIGWEFLWTSLIVMVFYIVASLFIKRLKRTIIYT